MSEWEIIIFEEMEKGKNIYDKWKNYTAITLSILYKSSLILL